jgi:hypothetical protein
MVILSPVGLCELCRQRGSGSNVRFNGLKWQPLANVGIGGCGPPQPNKKPLGNASFLRAFCCPTFGPEISLVEAAGSKS